MKILGIESTLREHEMELLYTASQLLACNEADIAAACLDRRAKIKAERNTYEEIEDAEAITFAKKTQSDTNRDTTILKIGKLMDSIDPSLRTRILQAAPSEIARMPQDKETQTIKDILLRLQALPADHPVRTNYEQTLAEQNAHFESLVEELGEVHSKFVLQRQAVVQIKLDNDMFRNNIYADLVKKYGRGEAGRFFLKGTSSSKPVQDPLTPA